MTRVLKYLYGVIGVFGAIHIGLGVVAGTSDEVARLWFVGSGLAILLVSLLGLSGAHRLHNDRVVSTSWIAGNLGGFFFVAYATWLLPEAQNFVLLAVVFASVAVAALTVIQNFGRGDARLCCAKTHTVVKHFGW